MTAPCRLGPSPWKRCPTSSGLISACAIWTAILSHGIDYSLKYLAAKSASRKFPVAGVSQEQVITGLTRFRELILSGKSDSEIRATLRQEFRVLRSVGWDGSGEVLFTGYYTPIFEARLKPDSRFRYPVYMA